jgi:hypothetical protein
VYPPVCFATPGEQRGSVMSKRFVGFGLRPHRWHEVHEPTPPSQPGGLNQLPFSNCHHGAGLVLARDKGKIEMACGGHEERSSILQRLSVSHHREAQQSSTNVHTFSPGTKDCDDGRVHAFPLQQLLCGGTHVPVPATSANLPPPRVETGQGNWKIVGSLRRFAIFCGLLGSLSLSLPFHKHSGRESSADHPSWHSLGPKTTRRRCPTLSCLCAHRQRPRPGCGCLVLGSLIWSEVCVKARLCLCMSWCLMRGGVADLRQ